MWRLGYHDHLCLNRRFIDSTERYIAYNPLKWALMHGAGSLHIREPLDSPRLDIGDYWKGVGNVALLDPALPIVSLRVASEGELSTTTTYGAVPHVVASESRQYRVMSSPL